MSTYVDHTFYESTGNIRTSCEITWNQDDADNFSEIHLSSTFSNTSHSQMTFKEFILTRQKFKKCKLHKLTKQTIYTYYGDDGNPFLVQKIFLTLRFDKLSHSQRKNINEIENHWPLLNRTERQLIIQKFDTETGELRKIESIITPYDGSEDKLDWKIGDRFINIPTILS